MKAFNRIFIGMFSGIFCLMLLGNILIIFSSDLSQNHAYEVEINRLMNYYRNTATNYDDNDQIHKLPISIDSQTIHVAAAEFLSVKADAKQIQDFMDGENPQKGEHYLIKGLAVDNQLKGYIRFRYCDTKTNFAQRFIILWNLFILLIALAITSTYIYIRNTMITPFLEMNELPYELSKGHITNDLKEHKQKYWGKFIWGLNLLRDSLEERKRREMQLEKEKRLMILTISHDIKTPLSAINLYARALKDNLYDDKNKIQEIAKQIEHKSIQIEAFIKHIVAMSTTELVNIPVLIEEFYLKDFVDSLTGYYQEKLSLLRTQFVIDSFSDKLLLGDKERLIEVMENLIENALKYGDGELIRVTFSQADYCELVTVYNSGCTLKKEELLHVFDSFWRGENASDKQGSGLGLYICKEIMHRMEGDIFVEQQKGGLAFTIVIPEV